MGFKAIGDILPPHAKKSGWGSQIEAAQLLERFQQIARTKWGAAVDQEMRPLYLKNQTLTVAVTNSSLAQELKLHEQEILEFLNQGTGRQVVARLRYLL